VAVVVAHVAAARIAPAPVAEGRHAAQRSPGAGSDDATAAAGTGTPAQRSGPN
jgi:hypothetical protein